MVHALGRFAPRLNGGDLEYEQKSSGEGQVASLRRLPAGPRVTISGALQDEGLLRPTRKGGRGAKQLVTNWIISYYAPKDP